MKRNHEQPSLFGPVDQYGGINPPMARTTDPESSHRAAEEHVASGQQSGNCEIVLAVLERMGKPATFREVFAAMNVDERQAMGDSGAIEVQRCLNDLRHDGEVENGDLRKCLVSDKPVQTWMVHG